LSKQQRHCTHNNIVIIIILSLDHPAGELRKIQPDITKILRNNNNNNYITENNKNISASSLQVGVVRACAATLPKPELGVLL